MEDSSESGLPCKDKLAFDSEEAAEGAAIYGDYQYGAKLNVYKCRHCELWHLASK